MRASIFQIIIFLHDTVHLLRLILKAIEPSSACGCIEGTF